MFRNGRYLHRIYVPVKESKGAPHVAGGYTPHGTKDGRGPLLKELLIPSLTVKGLLNPTADIVLDHEAGQFVAIDQHDTLT